MPGLGSTGTAGTDGSVAPGVSGVSGPPEGVLGGGQGALLGAEAKTVAGVFHVGPGDDLAIHALDGAANRESGVRGVGLQRCDPGGGD